MSRLRSTRTLAIVVDDRIADSPRASLEGGVDVLLAAFMEGLSRVAATLTHVWMTKRIAAGSTWWSLTDTTDRSVLIDRDCPESG
ncbi:DUF4192 family protein [Nocardia brasiliensis]|uniref:DUF4192 family protein n=1 Tax=Nocardia brasiliensis TaxID=37326 RepID=UPI002453D38C|nr:DUF4192 family protein [Nocardia brasiliensis]